MVTLNYDLASKPLGQSAYELKTHSERTWQIIALILGHPSGTASAVSEAAKRYAKRERLPWPAPGARPRGRKSTNLSRAGRAYNIKAAGGTTWVKIAIKLGYSPENNGRAALEMARRYAKRSGRAWPIG